MTFPETRAPVVAHRAARVGQLVATWVALIALLGVGIAPANALGTGAISGRVYLHAGQYFLPTAGEVVVVATSGPVSVQAAVAADGTYAITGLDSGNYTVFFQYSGSRGYYSHFHQQGATETTPSSTVAVRGGQIDLGSTYMDKAGSIAGSIKLHPGLAPPSGEVELVYRAKTGSTTWSNFSGPVVPDASGAYAIPNLVPGYYDIRVSYLGSGRYEPLTRGGYTVRDTPIPYNITVFPRGDLSGNVRLGESGPMAGANEVTAMLTDYASHAIVAGPVATDASGRFVFTNLPFGTYTLALEYAGTGPYMSSWVEPSWVTFGVTATSTSADQTLELTMPARIDWGGHVSVGPSPRSATAGEVEVKLLGWEPGTDNPLRSTFTDASGNYLFTDLDFQKTYRIWFDPVSSSLPDWFYPYGDRWYQGQSMYANTSQLDLDVIVGAYGEVSGRTRNTSGGNVGNVNVYVTRFTVAGEFVEQYEMTTDGNGIFGFFGLPQNYLYTVDFEPQDTGEGLSDYANQSWDGLSYYYYPDVIDMRSEWGQDLLATMYNSGSISGAVGSGISNDPALAGGHLSAHVMVYDYGSHQYVDTGDTYPVGTDGTYTIPKLSPDTYKVALVDGRVGGYPFALSAEIIIAEKTYATQNFWMAVGGSQATTFRDVPPNHTFSTQIEWMFAQGISTGSIDGASGQRTFNPTDPVSRRAMAAFLYRAKGSPAFTPPTEPSFRDVPVGAPFYKEIEWMKASDISTGYAVGEAFEFQPSKPVSRQAMSAFIYRFAGKPAFTPPAQQTFSDVATDAPFFREMEWMSANGISTGYQSGSATAFRPVVSVSRQAMAAFLYRNAHPGGVASRAIAVEAESSQRITSPVLVGNRDPKSLILVP